MTLTSKVAIVTGGARGIGLAIAGALLDRGASVAAGGRSAASLERARRVLAPDADRASRLDVWQADVRDPASVDAFVNAAVGRFGGLDILINNAGVGLFSKADEMSVDDWRRVIDTNLSGVFYGCRAAIPHLRRRGGGWIINVSSLAGKNAFVGGSAYCASKAGLNAFSEALMQEVRYDNIRVSYVMPGSVDTGFMSGGSSSGESDWKLAPGDVAQVVVDLLEHPARSLPSRVEIRPSKPSR
jgi:NAD(P)-dependent dehydrogenase (short-subunit alcohol dehydrogenase family)